MKLKELKVFLNTLTEEQLERRAIVTTEDKGVEIESCEISTEDYYFNEDYPEEGCFAKSDVGEDFDEETMKVALPNGSALLWGEV